MILQAVRDEDYAIGLGIQGALTSGANHQILLGRNEPAVQNYHRWVARFMNHEPGSDTAWPPAEPREPIA